MDGKIVTVNERLNQLRLPFHYQYINFLKAEFLEVCIHIV